MDLAEDFNRNRAIGIAMGVGGLLGFGLGFAVIPLSFADGLNLAPFLIGGLFSITMILPLSLGILIAMTPIFPSTTEEAVRMYNARAGLFPLVTPTRNAQFMLDAE